MKYGHILTQVLQTPWAILPEKLSEIVHFLAFKADGGEISEAEIAAYSARNAERRSNAGNANATAIIPLIGTITNRGPLYGSSGMTGIEGFSDVLQTALADDSIKRILIDIDSPGGSVFGVSELSSEIFNARGKKPIFASVNSLAASAAYWIGSAADKMYISPGGLAGSIGVYAAHVDASKMEELRGTKTTLVSAGKYKVEGNPFEPLSTEARGAIQKDVDAYYQMFTKDVARNRGVSVEDVRNGFGQGRVVGAKEAHNMGMVDGIEPLSETLSRQRLLTKESAKAAHIVYEYEIDLLSLK